MMKSILLTILVLFVAGPVLAGSTVKRGPGNDFVDPSGVATLGPGVSDDTCDTAGELWWDSTDGAVEFCQAASGTPDILGSNPGSDTTLTFTIDSDNTGGSEPADGAGFKIEGGSGDVTITYNTTSNTVEISGASGYTFDAPIATPAAVSSKTAATYTIGTDDSDESWGSLFLNGDNDAIAFTLPAAQVGMGVTIMNGAGVSGAITVDCDASDAFVLNGVQASNGEAIVSTGAAADRITVEAISAALWLVTDSEGTWAEETP
jgi:hypothetical protein